MTVEFECIVRGRTASATVETDATSDGPLRTLRERPSCGLETIWLEPGI